MFLDAGVLDAHPGAPWEVPPEDWRRILDVDLGGVVNGLRSFVPRLLAAGEPAHVVITASLAGAAVARHAAVALEGTPVRVHVVCPALASTGTSPEGVAAEEVAAHALALVDGERLRPGAASAPASALLVNGTVGAGKTTAAEHLGRLLAEQGVPHATVDLDELRRAWPAPADDPFHLALELANVRDVAANHRRAGAQRLVLAGVLSRTPAPAGATSGRSGCPWWWCGCGPT